MHLSTMERAREAFEGDLRPTFHLAPPILGGTDPDGRPKKRAFGPWILPVFRALAAMKGLRGRALDPFGWLPERREERALIAEYEADMAEWLSKVVPETEALIRELAELPLGIRGYGPVKTAAVSAAAARRAELIAALQAGGAPLPLAAE